MPGFDDFTDAPLTTSWADTAKRALGTGWRWATTPLLPQIQEAARGISDAITTHKSGESMAGSYARGALGGAIEGIGNIFGDFTSPLGIATAALPKVLTGIKSARRAGVAAQEAMGGRSAADVLLGGPTTEAQAADMLLGTKPRDSSIDELIRQLDTGPRGAGTRPQPPFGASVIEGNADELAARSAASRRPDPYQRGPQPSGAETDPLDSRFVGRPTDTYFDEPISDFMHDARPSGANVDPLDTRFASRPQGTRVGEYDRTPFASSLDDASQSSLEILDDDLPSALNGSGESAASVEAINRQRAMADKGQQFVVYDRAGQRKPLIGPDAVDYQVRPGETYGIEGPDGFQALDDLGGRVPSPARPTVESSPVPVSSTPPVAQTPDEVIRRFFRYDEAPYSASGKRRLLPEEVTREQGLKDTNLGDERGTPTVGSQFIPRGGTSYRDLPYGERTRELANDRYFENLMGNESGFLDTSQLPAMADAANKLRYFSMLSSPLTQAKNVLGNVGAATSHAAETALGGKPREAWKVLSEFFNPQTVRDAVREYNFPSTGETRWGTEQGPLGIPGRIMGAIDRGTKDALGRAGVGSDLAEEITFTNRPKSEAGQVLTDALGRSSVGKMLVPFSRTATNILERGLERTPIIGSIAEKLSGGNLQTSIPKQILGAIAAAAGAEAGGDNPYVEALLAPYSVPYSLGSGMATAAEKPGSTSADVISAALAQLMDAAPLPTRDYTLDPRQYLASFVPNILRDVNPMIGTDPSSFDTSHSLTGKAIAKIPFLNELLLRHKAQAARAPR